MKLGLVAWAAKKSGVATQKAADQQADTAALKDRVHVEAEVARATPAAVDDELSKWSRG
jgi:HJR/Mrr/RecB family endonuclease